MRIYEEVQEEEERPWEEVIKRRRWEVRPSRYYSTRIEEVIKKKKAEKKRWRLASVIIYQSNASCLQAFFFNGSLFSTIEKSKEKERWGWESLPSTALLNIFCNTELKDRLKSIPLVCKSWKYVTDDPRCWSSMIPDSVSPEDAFIKNTSGYVFESYECKYYYMKLVKKKDYDFFLMGISRLFKEEGDDQVDEEEEIEEVRVGLSRLLTLIKKSGGGAAITTLYLSPFTPYGSDEILHLIANCCPNLKHISCEILCKASTEALLQVINKCKKLELVDLSYSEHSYSEHADAPLVLQEMGKCLPNLRGIRINISGDLYSIGVSIATYLPQLKLLSLFTRHLIIGEHISTIIFSCLELQYLYVKGHLEWLYYLQDIVDQACAQIPECYFEKYYPESWDYSSYYYDSEWLEWLEWRESMDNNNEAYMDDCPYFLKQRKEDQYVSILKEKKEYHYNDILKKTERDQCNSSFKKKKKKKYQYDSTVRKKKKIDQCDYADYVIR